MSVNSRNILIDGRPLLNQRAGIGRYTYQLIRALFDEETFNRIYLYGLKDCGRYTRIRDKSALEDIEKLSGNANKLKTPFPFRKATRLLTTLIDHMRKQPQINVSIWTDFLGAVISSSKTIITIPDMAHYYYPQYTWPGHDSDLKEHLKDHAHKADLVLCISENTKKDVINILGIPENKVWVTYMGVSEEFRLYQDKDVIDDLRIRFSLPERFILFVGTVEPRKNLNRLIEAYHILYSKNKIKYPLVIVGGKGWKNEPLYQRVKELKIEDKLIFTGYVSDSDLPLFYNAATVFVYPSLYEGFGIPVIEAMACGVPVVTSNVSSLPEVAGDAAILVNPEDPEEIASAIHKIVTDKVLYESLREKGFSQASKFTWAACAKKTLEAIHYVLDEN